jgi:hypothetical protein
MCGEAGMNYDEIDMDRVRAFAQGKATEYPKWTPPTWEDFAWYELVQAADATMTSAGFVMLYIDTKPGGAPWIDVKAMTTFRPQSDEPLTFHALYDKRWQLMSMLRQTLRSDAHIVYEMAPVSAPGMFRPESSLFGGSAVYDACQDATGHPPVAISKNHVGSILCNAPYASKNQIKEAVGRYIPQSITRRWNEHTRDAAAVALTHLYDLKHGEAS